MHKKHISTQLIHHDYTAPGNYAALQLPSYRASTILFDNTAALARNNSGQPPGYTYGLHGTPSSLTLQERLATLEGGQHCLLLPSGLAAISLVNLALLAPGDELLLPENVYGPSQSLAHHELQKFGITPRSYKPLDLVDLAAKINAKTKLVWIEAPGSCTMEFPDLLGILRLCRERGILTAIDNTWGAGLALCAFDVAGSGLGADISVQALTKFPCGGGDVLMGSVITRESALHKQLGSTHMRMGWGVSGADIDLVLRSLPSMALRYAQHDNTARQVARVLATRAEVAQVLHPALPQAPGHAYWQAACAPAGEAQSLAAGLFSIVFAPAYSRAQVRLFCEDLQLFKLGYSWGGHLSLVMPYERAELVQQRSDYPYAGELVRLYCGLEDAADLEADVLQALDKLQAH